MNLKNEMMNLKGKLENLEADLTNQMMELEVRAEEWHKKDEEIDNLIKSNKDKVISLNVGGKNFQTKYETLLSFKDTLFCKLMLDKKVDFSKEIFIDRDFTYFPYILSYLRNKKLILAEKLSTKEFNKLFEDAQFYELQELIDIVGEFLKEIKFVKFEVNGTYSSGTNTAGTQNIDHINNYEDRSCKNGICATSPGWIIFELNRVIEWDTAEIGGWNGNTSLWGASNGSSARIETSLNKTDWKQVGTTPSSMDGTPKEVKVTKSSCLYVKITHTSYLGIGYFKIKKI